MKKFISLLLVLVFTVTQPLLVFTYGEELIESHTHDDICNHELHEENLVDETDLDIA